MARITCLLILTTLYKTLNAQPKSFTDDPFIDDEKFTEKGKRAVIHLILNLSGWSAYPAHSTVILSIIYHSSCEARGGGSGGDSRVHPL